MKNFTDGIFIAAIIFFIFALFFGIGTLPSAHTLLQLDNALIILGYLVTCASTGLAIAAYIKRQEIQYWLQQKNKFIGAGNRFEVSPDQVDALIIPLSREEPPQWLINHLQPTHVGLIYTTAANSTDTAQRIINNPINSSINFIPIAFSSEHAIADAFRPNEAKGKTQTLLTALFDMNIAKNRIFIDTTGGTAPMSIGVFQAAEEAAVSTIYVTGNIKNPENNTEADVIYMSRHNFGAA